MARDQMGHTSDDAQAIADFRDPGHHVGDPYVRSRGIDGGKFTADVGGRVGLGIEHIDVARRAKVVIEQNGLDARLVRACLFRGEDLR